MPQSFAGGDGVFAIAEAVVGGGDGRHPRSQSKRLVYYRVVRGIVYVRVAEGQGRHQSAQHVNRLACVREGTKDIHRIRGKLAAGDERLVEIIQLGLGRQLSVDEEVENLFVGRMGGQI